MNQHMTHCLQPYAIFNHLLIFRAWGKNFQAHCNCTLLLETMTRRLALQEGPLLRSRAFTRYRKSATDSWWLEVCKTLHTLAPKTNQTCAKSIRTYPQVPQPKPYSLAIWFTPLSQEGKKKNRSHSIIKFCRQHCFWWAGGGWMRRTTKWPEWSPFSRWLTGHWSVSHLWAIHAQGCSFMFLCFEWFAINCNWFRSVWIPSQIYRNFFYKKLLPASAKNWFFAIPICC